MVKYLERKGKNMWLLEKIDNADYYHTQRNNKINPFGACNITSLNMIFDFLGISMTDDYVMNLTNTPEIRTYYEKNLSKIFGMGFLKKNKLNTIWKVLEEVANKTFHDKGMKIRARFTSFKGINDIVDEMRFSQIPVIIGTTFTESGHVVVCKGYTDINGIKQDLIVHDPYGNPMTKYKNVDGRNLELPINFITNKIKYDRGIMFQRF